MDKLKGYVAFLDVLGFRELVGRDDHLKELTEYVDVVYKLIETRKGRIQYVLFSDSLVVNTIDDSLDSFELLARSCSALYSAFLSKGVGIRGAISCGPFIRSKESQHGVIIAGRPIVDAYHYEQQQDWIGIMLSPSVLMKIPDLKSRCPNPSEFGALGLKGIRERYPWALSIQHYQRIPFHASIHPLASESVEGFSIVPLNADENAGSPEQLTDSLKSAQSQLERMKMLAPNPQSQRKYSETLGFIGRVIHCWTNFKP